MPTLKTPNVIPTYSWDEYSRIKKEHAKAMIAMEEVGLVDGSRFLREVLDPVSTKRYLDAIGEDQPAPAEPPRSAPPRAEPDVPTFGDITVEMPFWLKFLMILAAVGFATFLLVSWSVFTTRLIDWYGGYGLAIGLTPLLAALAFMIAVTVDQSGKEGKKKNTA